MDCYTGIIGLSNNSSHCNEAGRPEEYNVSTSGLYLDGLSGFSVLHDYACSNKMWHVLSDSVDKGVNEFKFRLRKAINEKYEKSISPFSAFVGSRKSNQNYTPSKPIIALVIDLKNVISGRFYLDAIGAQFAMTGTVDWELRSSEDPSIVLETFTLDTQAVTYKETPINKSYPTYSKYGRITYFLTHTVGTNVPRETSISCGCGGETPQFNYNSPQYRYRNRKGKDQWLNFMQVGSMEIDSYDELNDIPDSLPISSMGLSLCVRFDCAVEEEVCSSNMDYTSGIGYEIAKGVQLACGYTMAEILINMRSISETTLIDYDIMDANMALWYGQVTEIIKCIVDSIGNDFELESCLMCSTKKRSFRALLK